MRRWSINLFKVFGIQLELHASFALLVAYVAYNGWHPGRGPGMLWDLFVLVLFFVCVVLHELGHSLTARRYGVQVPRILLLPIGGMAQLDRMPREPKKELIITVAGPAVNFGFVAIFLPTTLWAFFGSKEVAPYSVVSLVTQLFFANLVMGTFNLLPVFPMDGGRIFRAMLATQTSYLEATRWAARTGKVLAVGLAIVMAFCWHSYFGCALFIFIYWAADMEYRFVAWEEKENSRQLTKLSSVPRSPEAGESPLPPLLAQDQP